MAGQYGVGLLGFWCIGRYLELRSRVAGSDGILRHVQELLDSVEPRRPRATGGARGLQRDSIRFGTGTAGLQRAAVHLSTCAFAPHRHDTYAIGLTETGVQAFDYRGSAHISTTGNVVVLHPDETHDGHAGSEAGQNAVRYPAQAERSCVSAEREIGRDRLGDHLGILRNTVVHDLTPIAVGPAVKASVLNRGQVVGRGFIAQPVALVDHRPECAGGGLEGHADGIAQAGGIDAGLAGREVQFMDAGTADLALHALGPVCPLQPLGHVLVVEEGREVGREVEQPTRVAARQDHDGHQVAEGLGHAAERVLGAGAVLHREHADAMAGGHPAHGVGRIVSIEEQEIAGAKLELFVINFEKDKMTLRVPTTKLASVGMRKLSEEKIVKKALGTLKGKARIKRTMWSRRAQEYEAKINSGDLVSIAEVVRDLYRSEAQPEQSYSERQLYEAALDRMAREIAAVEKLDEASAIAKIDDVLAKTARHAKVAAEAEARTRAA